VVTPVLSYYRTNVDSRCLPAHDGYIYHLWTAIFGHPARRHASMLELDLAYHRRMLLKSAEDGLEEVFWADKEPDPSRSQREGLVQKSTNEQTAVSVRRIPLWMLD